MSYGERILGAESIAIQHAHFAVDLKSEDANRIWKDLHASWLRLKVTPDQDSYLAEVATFMAKIADYLPLLDSVLTALKGSGSGSKDFKKTVMDSKAIKAFAGTKRDEFKEWNEKLINQFSIVYPGFVKVSIESRRKATIRREHGTRRRLTTSSQNQDSTPNR